MPPRKSSRISGSASASTSTSASTPSISASLRPIADQVESAIQNWESGGSNSIRAALVQHVKDESASPATALVVAQIWISILNASLTVEQIAAFFVACKEECKEEEFQGRLEEGLVDVVEVLEEEREDVEEVTKNGNDAMDVGVDEEMPVKGGQKGLEVIKRLLDEEHLAPHIPTLILNAERLIPLGLHPIPGNPQGLQRMLVKKTTTLFFKQSKYNLLRESSEGFSGLVVLLTSPDSLPPSPVDEDGAERRERAKRVWSKVMGLIGYFNLSPPRVLDLILEVASCHAAAHWRFWLDLLRCSPWGSTADSGDIKGKGKEKAVDWQIDEEAAIEGCLKRTGDRVLAQVLGVKFGFCQKPDGEETPIGLIYFSALLLKHGFVSLSDLLPFLSPDDTEMANIQRRHASAGTSRSGPSNALANSVLLDDDAPTSETKAAESTGPPAKPPPEQRIQLLQALLAVGHMPAALYFLGQFPWIAQYSPTIADLIIRIVDIGTEDLYRRLSDTWAEADMEEGELRLEAPAPTYKRPNKDTMPTLLVPSPPDTPTTLFEFFYPDWSDGLDRWDKVEHIRAKGLRWLSLVRGLGGRRVEVMVRLCRLGVIYFQQLQKEKEDRLGLSEGLISRKEMQNVQPTEAEIHPWLEILRVSLLPALSASTFAAAFDIEIWRLLRFFPYAVRYGLYGEWRDSTCRFGGRYPCPIAAQAAAESTREVKKALSRVTAAQTAPTAGPAGVPDRGPARALAKLSHSNPCALWATAVTQVKSYSNIGQFIVEAGRYMTQLSMDVATFTLVDTLSDDTASRLNSQGTGVAAWLENLAAFVGDFNRRYAAMDLEPVLQFIINRLMRGQSADLTILQSLISIMSGESKIDNDAISNDQLKAYGSGREMIREAFNATVISISRPVAPGDPGAQAKAGPIDKTKSTKKSLPRLISGLRDTGLDMPIWIALAQTRQGAVDKMVGAPIKAMSSMQDNCHDIFIQYGDLLSEQLSSAEHIKRTPDLESLVSEYGLDFAQAFQILRPKLNAEIDKTRAEEKAAMAAKLDAEKRALEVKVSSPSQPTTPLPSSPKIETMQVDEEDADGSEYGSEPPTPTSALTSSVPLARGKSRKRWWPAALDLTMRQAHQLLPAEVLGILSAEFFVIFWHLSTPDISFAGDMYQKAIDKITALEKDVSGWRTTATKEQKDERARLKARVEALTKERDVQSTLVNALNKRRLRQESSKWFGATIAENNWKTRLSNQLHQYCFYPRAILTPSDAVFVPKMIRMMHDLGSPGFSTLFAYSNFFSHNLAACIFSCTENEARNLGRCLSAIMTDLDLWHADEQRYQREAIGLPEKPVEGEEPKTLPGMFVKGKNQVQEKPMAWTTFRNFYVMRFHNPLLDALISCWAETDFMHIKNAITVALQVLKSFPVLIPHGEAVEAAIEKLVQRGKDGALTPDVLHQCQAYLRQLKLRQNTKPYVDPPKFHSSGKTTIAVPDEPAKNTPTGPRSSGTVVGETDGKGTNGSSTPIPEKTNSAPKVNAPPVSASDPKALRARLEESKALRSASAAAVKEEKGSTARKTATDKTEAPSKPALPTRSASTTVVETVEKALPAGPRSTRASASVPPAATGKQDSPAPAEVKPTPTGPSKPASNGPADLPTKPGQPASTSMGPPTSLSVDEERAAARARKFGTLAKPPIPTGPASSTATPVAAARTASPAQTPTTTVKTEPARPKSPTPTASSRRTSPVPSRPGHRSRSIESRTSERSKRDRHDDRDKRRDEDRGSRENGGRSRTPSVRGKEDDDKDRKRQEELLQARHDRLAADDDKPRRSSRDTSRRETEKERDERKAKDRERDKREGKHADRDKDREREKDRDKEKERERERDKRSSAQDPAGLKRKREEEPRRIDPIGRRDDRDDPRDRDRRRDDRDRRPDERDRRGDERRHDDRREGIRPHDHRDDDRSRRGPDRDDRDRNGRDGPRDPPPHVRPRSPERRDSRPPSRLAEPTNGDRTPKRDPSPRRNARVELLPSGQGDRIVEAPRTRGGDNTSLPPRPPVSQDSARSSSQAATRSSTQPAQTAPAAPTPIQSKGPHGLPARPGLTNQPAPSSSLASRMGPAPTNNNSRPSNPSPDRSRRDSPDRKTEERGDDKAEPRKRAHDDNAPPTREDSPGASKRIRIDRDKAKRDRGGSRMLANAMKSANDEKPQ